MLQKKCVLPYLCSNRCHRRKRQVGSRYLQPPGAVSYTHLAFFASLVGRVESVAISCVFSPVRNDHELRAAEICRAVMGPDVHISISSEIGSMGLVERENATILLSLIHI